jgi:hypothetical protein
MKLERVYDDYKVNYFKATVTSVYLARPVATSYTC